MKKIILALFLLAGAVSVTNAQDVITKKNGDEIKAKVLEVGTNDVKYKRFGNESGPTYTLSKAEIFKIKYESGESDLFDATPAAKPVQPAVQAAEPKAEPKVVEQVRSEQRETVQPVSTQPYRQAYIGLGFGPAFMMDDLDGAFDSGTQVNINFGYLLSDHIGIAASFFSTDFPAAKLKDTAIGLQGLMAGPLFSTFAGASDKIELDLRPMLGYAQAHTTYNGKSGTTDDDAIVAIGLGGSVRFNLSSRFSLSANLDYYYGKVDGVNLSSAGISVGANSRF